MSNPIPPLLCSTPPPIDFDENNDNDDDFGAFETADAEYGGQSLPGTPEHKSEKKSVNLDLPLPNDVEYPLYSNITTSVFTSIEQEENAMKAEGNIINQITKIEGIENGEKIKITPNDDSLVNNLENLETNKENINEEVILDEIKAEEDIKTDDIPKDFLICEKNQQQQKSIKSSRENSPQSLELYSADLSEDDDESIGEFQAAVESKYDDNTSLPSLKFDPLGISKCATPIIDDKIIQNNNLDENYENLDDKSKFSAFESEYTENNQSDDWPNTNSLNENEKESVDEQNIADDNVDEFGEFNSVIAGNNLENFRKDSLEESKNNDFNVITDQILKSEILEEEEAKFRNFEALSLPNDDEIDIKSDSDILEKSAAPAITNAEPLFEADFSQFETSTFETPIFNKTENIENNCNTVSAENSNEVDDEFEDFQDFTSAPIVPETEEDDEFGEFNDFIEAPTQINVPSFKAVNIDEKLKPILNLMFPLDPTNTEDNPECYKNFEKLNSTLKHLDSADALGYQWANSNVKHSLIKSLGIDSRNILYGEKWNSSMPRFAANLGFNPLEPLKPVKMNGSIITSSTSQSSNQITESLSFSRTDVPAVEFDWNSSGLVNPLDASHAHTLLLDLDQLVVVANLDKIKLDSSSPCPSATLDLNDHHNSSIGTSGIMSTNLHRHFTSDNQFSMINSDNTTTSDALMMMDLIDGFVNNKQNITTANCINVDVFGDGFNYANYISDTTATANFNVDSIIDNATTTTATNYTTNFHTGFYNKTNIDPFNQYLDCRIKEILHERKTETIHTPQSCNIDQSIQQQTTSTTTAATEAASNNSETANSIPFVSIINNDITSTIDTDEINNDLSNSYQFDTLSKHNEIQSNTTTNPSTFVVPLKETHIFTPSKTEVVVTRSTKCSSSSGGGEKEPIDFDFKTAAAGIVIDEKVIKKEYRDIEYDPEKLSTSHLENDEFQEFQSSQQINIEQNFETSIDRNETGWSFDLTSLENKNDSIITKFPTINTTDMLMGDSTTQQAGETLKEFPAVVSSNTSTDFFNIENDFPPISNQSVEINIGTLDKKEKLLNSVVNSSFQKSEFVRNNVQKPKDNSSIDDEFSDFQSVLPPQQSQPPKDRIKTVLVEEKTKSRTCTPTFSDEMILSPAVLLPQAIKINSSPKIEWAGPDINPQELARIEEMFAQSKSSPKRDTQQNLSSIETFSNNDDDDWSDFVSVPAFSSFNNTQTIQSASPYKPNFCSQSESNDDEWSDFVSSVPITSNNPAQLPQTQFNSWNQTQAYNSLGSYNQITPPNQLANNVPMSKFNHSINNNNNTISQYLIQGLAVPVESQPNHFLPHHPLPLSQINNVTSQQKQQHHQQQQQQQPQHHHNQQQQQRNQNVIKSQLNRTPSISLIPDLRYVAPRNFINIPRSTTNKK